jgi:hypothetical protein
MARIQGVKVHRFYSCRLETFRRINGKPTRASLTNSAMGRTEGGRSRTGQTPKDLPETQGWRHCEYTSRDVSDLNGHAELAKPVNEAPTRFGCSIDSLWNTAMHS